MGYKGVSLRASFKFWFLNLFDVGGHTVLGILMSEVKGIIPHGMDACKSNELIFVTHLREFILKGGNDFIAQLLLPVEGGRAIISE
jgi:hypothetical protein